VTRTPPPSPSRLLHAALAAAVLAAGAAARAQEASILHPTTVYTQAGAAEHASAVVVGATWNSGWHDRWRIGDASIYWEASIGRWTATHDATNSSGLVTQFGITPVLRIEPRAGSRWFFEAGIGLNVLTPIYQNGDKRFSTAFNFGDHLAVGRRFGDDGRHELALRIQHFSNAGIRKPNPGEDFLQLRYAVHM
jgi:lipid A 3-O-deacylase